MQVLGAAWQHGGRTQLSEAGQSLLAFCDQMLAVCA